MKCGLLGRSLGHSFSPQIHSLLGDYDYLLFEKEPEQIDDFLKNGDFSGINVTIPYKKTVIPYLDELTPQAKALGAVNTILRRDGRLIGHNTDYFGFQTMLRQLPESLQGKYVLVLGSGGASNTAVAVLKEQGAKVTVISRSAEDNYDNLSKHRSAQIIVNTTPVGMYPNTGKTPLDPGQFPELTGVLDVIYNPARTQLLLDAEKIPGVTTVNGLLMLVAQAWEASRWFTGKQLEYDCIYRIHKQLELQMQNIILIGMPGSGKTTVGRLVAEALGRTFVDADAMIEEAAGKSIPRIFAEDGEDVFRDWETKVLARLGSQSGLVIATGGGCVTRQRNYNLLHQNGRIFWLERNWQALPRNGRPLSAGADLKQMEARRRPLYAAFSDCRICNDGTAGEAAAKILDLWRSDI